MSHHLRRFVPLGFMLAVLCSGCAGDKVATTEPAKPAAVEQKQEARQYVGTLLLKSNKAKTLTIEMGKGEQAKTVTIKFDDKTQGLDKAINGTYVIVNYDLRNGEEFATEVKPKLAQLPAGVSEIKTAELKNMIDQKASFVLVDSRPAGRYAQAHLPGAISVPENVLKEKKEVVLPKEKDKLFIFYCGGVTCGLSTNSAKMAREIGYTNVRVYLEGEPVWSKAGYPTYASNKFVAEDNIVLIDLRDAKKATVGRIARAVSVPAATLKDKAAALPLKAPFVLYGEDEAQAMSAMKTLQEEGAKKVSLVEGGLAGWTKSGGQVVKGPVETHVTWKRKPVSGEVSMAEFKKAVGGQAPDAVIVDVRARNEVAEGKLKSSVSIPLDELSKRLGDVPKGKKIYTHCVTGARAEMAAKEMKKHGIDAYFLVADVECKGEKCTFTE